MSDKARIAIIGAGWWSTATHIPSIQANSDADLIALCDKDAEKLEAAAENYGIGRTYKDVTSMLAAENLDGAVVATNHASHYPVVKACLEHELHVLAEKPMTLKATHARELVELARERGRELLIGYPFNYLDFVKRAREVIQSGELGAVHHVNCVFATDVLAFLKGEAHFKRGKVHGPGAVYANPELSGGGHGHLQITHLAGLMFFVTDLRMHQVSAMMNNHGLVVDVTDAMAVQFDNGALGTVSGTADLGGTRAARHRVQLYCERGVVRLSANPYTGEIFRPDQEPERYESAETQPYVYPSHAPADNLVGVILGRADNGSPAEVGWRAVELLDAAYRSAAQNGVPVTREELYA